MKENKKYKDVFTPFGNLKYGNISSKLINVIEKTIYIKETHGKKADVETQLGRIICV